MLVTLLRYSGNNSLALAAIPEYIGNELSTIAFGRSWLMIAPFIGALGAFLAGSVTVSNMMLATAQVEAGIHQGLLPELVLALQSLGAGLGNMFALHNVIAATTMIKAQIPFWKILLFNALIASVLLIITGLTAILLW